MRRLAPITLLLATAAYAVNLTKVAAVTTIAVNALEIKSTIAKARAAAKAAKKAGGKVVKLVRRKTR